MPGQLVMRHASASAQEKAPAKGAEVDLMYVLSFKNSSRQDTQPLSTNRPLSLTHLQPLFVVTAVPNHCLLHNFTSQDLFQWPHFCEECMEKSQQQVDSLTHLQ